MFIDAKPAVRKQILRELQILHECNSKYIVSFYGAYLREPHICMCMEFMDKRYVHSSAVTSWPSHLLITAIIFIYCRFQLSRYDLEGVGPHSSRHLRTGRSHRRARPDLPIRRTPHHSQRYVGLAIPASDTSSPGQTQSHTFVRQPRPPAPAHTDVKPSNILVNSQGQIKICDFGVSGELINSIADTFVGTSTYMSVSSMLNSIPCPVACVYKC